MICIKMWPKASQLPIKNNTIIEEETLSNSPDTKRNSEHMSKLKRLTTFISL